MRIAHVTATFLPYRSGTANVCYHNARELARRGHEVHVFTAAVHQAPPQETLDGIIVHRLRPLLRLGNAPVIPQLLTCLRGFDLIHLHYPFIGGELAAVAARLTHTPLVITYHQDVLLDGPTAWIEWILRQTTGRFTLRSAERLLFTTQDYGQASYIRPLLAGREDRVGELPNGVDTQVFSPGAPPREFAAHCGLKPGERAALLVAGLDRPHYFKGVDVFLRAIAQLPADIHGIIVGDGDLRSSYEQSTRSLGIGQRVFFAGRVSAADLPDYYRLANMTVLPSVTMGEAFGLVLLEAMACAKPVIASNLPGVRSVVADGQDGFLVEPKDVDGLVKAMLRLFDDPSLQQEMGRSGREKVEAQYAWPRITDQLEHIYASILPGAEPGLRENKSLYER